LKPIIAIGSVLSSFRAGINLNPYQGLKLQT